MAYKKADLEKQAIKAIKDNNVIFITELIAYLPCALSTFYDLELEKSEHIKNEIDINRIKNKKKLRENWSKEKSAPVLQLASYKLNATEDELRRLSVQEKEHESQDQTVDFEYEVIE